MTQPVTTHSTAWSDESFQEKDSAGFYIIAAAVIEPDGQDAVREAMLALRGSGGQARRKLHWTEMDHRQRTDAAQTVASLVGLHVVAIGTPVPAKRQERARAKCLTELVRELHAFEVGFLYMEARESALNRRDVQTVTSARHQLPKGSPFRVEHVHGKTEPLLWVADVVAGACRFEQLGQGDYRQALGDSVLDFDVLTDC